MQLRKATRKKACENAPDWMDIKGYEGLYQVHWRGIVRNAVTKKVLSPGLGGVGYYTVALAKDKKHKSFSIHRLVALHYIPNELGKQYVNHKDGIKTNNHLANLEWCTPSENEKHAHSIGLKKSSKDKIPVCQYDDNGELIKEYGSMTEAEACGFGSGNIARSCKRGIKHKGYYFKYKN